MYEDARTLARCSIGNTGKFEIRVGVHQRSCLSPLLYIIVMDARSGHVRREVILGMLYSVDLIVAEKEEAGIVGYRHVSLIGRGSGEQ